MTERVKKILETLKSKEYKKQRCAEWLIDMEKYENMTPVEQKTAILCSILNSENPVFIEDDRIGFYRYQTYTSFGKQFGNITPSYDFYLENGFEYVYNYIKSKEHDASDRQKNFITNALGILDAASDYCKRYYDMASDELKKTLKQISKGKPQSYHEALVMLKFIIFLARINGTAHITLGRFDQYMYPFYKMDKLKGKSDDEILELTEEFFLSINFDTDLYHGIQLGDNGQSIMLGGTNPDGTDSFNELSGICMDASMELNLIDPKINLRVNKNTPMSLYLKGTQMTKLGLGFPQYCNDDIVIPGLIKMGYAPKDAYNYSVAACWEFIVPEAYDIPNIKTMNFPKIVNNTLFEHLDDSSDFNVFFEYVKKNIDIENNELIKSADEHNYSGDICLSLLYKSCIEKCLDFGENVLKYKNYGFHGAGIANASDALAAIKKLIFDEKTVSKQELISALNADFKGYETLRGKLLECPKMGNNNDYVDDISCKIMDAFCESLNGKKNKYGGIIRPGTGSAQGYIFESKNIPATADGRYAYTPYSSSFSPSLTAKLNGPLSVIQSFTKFDMTKIPNGGPLTIEIHDTTFRNDYGTEKVAQLVKLFIELGGHQIQLNSINRDKLIEAQKHPELYPNLIVRVWGWSGYFNELDTEFQNHIIKRTEFQM